MEVEFYNFENVSERYSFEKKYLSFIYPEVALGKTIREKKIYVFLGAGAPIFDGFETVNKLLSQKEIKI